MHNRSGSTWMWISALSIAASAAVVSGSPASDMGSGSWESGCSDDKCFASARFEDRAGGRLFATVSVVFPDGNSRAELRITTPLGVALEAGVRVVVGDTFWESPFKVCFPDGCLALTELDPDALETLADTESIDLRFFAFGDPVPKSGILSMKGFREGLRRIGAP